LEPKKEKGKKVAPKKETPLKSSKPVKEVAKKNSEKKPEKEVKKASPVKKGATQAAKVQNKLPSPKEIKNANRKLVEATKTPIVQVSSNSKNRYGNAKTAYSPDNEVVTTTHRSIPRLVGASSKK
jgi:hypothetical protein